MHIADGAGSGGSAVALDPAAPAPVPAPPDVPAAAEPAVGAVGVEPAVPPAPAAGLGAVCPAVAEVGGALVLSTEVLPPAPAGFETAPAAPDGVRGCIAVVVAESSAHPASAPSAGTAARTPRVRNISRRLRSSLSIDALRLCVGGTPMDALRPGVPHLLWMSARSENWNAYSKTKQRGFHCNFRISEHRMIGRQRVTARPSSRPLDIFCNALTPRTSQQVQVCEAADLRSGGSGSNQRISRSGG